AEEVARGVPAGHGVQGGPAGPAVPRGAGFVKADVAGAADAQDLQVDAAGPPDQLLVADAVVLDVAGRHGPVGDVDVLRRDVDVVEEGLAHPAVVAVRVVRLHRVVFVEVESEDAREVEPGLLVQADQFAVQPHGGRAGGQAQDGRAVGGVV